MFLNNIELHNFRNYEQLKIQSFAPVNLFIGNNAQGKTNFIEAIYVLALTKSHRTSKYKQLIRFGQCYSRVVSEINKSVGNTNIELCLTEQGKKAKINRVEQCKLSNFIGSLNVVLFAPEHLEIIKGNPSTRRNFLNIEISQIAPTYIYNLQQYQKVLNHRNHLLKKLCIQNESQLQMLQVWNEQLVKYGVKIVKKRKKIIKKLEQWAKHIHRGIVGSQETFRLNYVCSFSEEEEEDEAILLEQFMLKLLQAKNQEIRTGTTLIGPHRDDIAFYINDKEVRTYGSQGQQRTIVLCLKLAEIQMIYEETNEYPILLLDDVFSELDFFRQTQLIDMVQHRVQTFITGTGVESLNICKIKNSKIYKVCSGSITS